MEIIVKNDFDDALTWALAEDNFWSIYRTLARHIGPTGAIMAPGRMDLAFAGLPSLVAHTKHALNRCGIGRGDRVAVVLPKGPENATVILALVACTTLVPFNPACTEDEFRQFFERLGLKAVIVSAETPAAAREAAAALDIMLIELVPDSAAPAGTFHLTSDRTGTGAADGWNGRDDTAIIFLTSGSTGRPKLVPFSVGNLIGEARDMRKTYALRPGDRSVHTMPMYYAHGIRTALIKPLCAGSGVICLPKFELGTFLEQLQTSRATWYSASFAIQRAIFDGLRDHPDAARLPRLRFIISASGRLDPEVCLGLEKAFDAPVLVQYSASETGTLAAVPLRRTDPKPGTVGTVQGSEIAILGPQCEFLAPGQEGEIAARGPTVFTGYLDDPEQNEAAFFNGWFRTGDLGRFDADGYLTITGRLKETINRGGEKINPTEAERVLSEHRAVRSACAFGVPHPTLGQEIVAAIVLEYGMTATEDELTAFARRSIAAVKVPRRIFFIDAMPVGRTGKTDRLALARAHADLALRAAPAYVAPRRDIDRRLAAIWCKVLGVERVGLNDNFFDLGGDSLLAAKLFSHVDDAFNFQLPLAAIFEAPTVGQMATLVRAPQAPSAWPVLVEIRKQGSKPRIFAVPGVGGNVVGYVDLARRLGLDQPLVALQARGLDGLEAPLTRIADIAAFNLSQMRRLQPEGPYYILGACIGGVIAFEMARQLREQGAATGLLALIDPPFLKPEKFGKWRIPVEHGVMDALRVARFVADRARLYVQELGAIPVVQWPRFFRAKGHVIGGVVTASALPNAARRELNQRRVIEANRTALRGYQPPPYHDPIQIFATAERPPRLASRDLDWQSLSTGEITIEIVPGKGSGDVLKEPNVRVLAEALRKLMARVHPDTKAPELRPVEERAPALTAANS